MLSHNSSRLVDIEQLGAQTNKSVKYIIWVLDKAIHEPILNDKHMPPVAAAPSFVPFALLVC